MKIQLKHSNVVSSGSAKQPTAVNMLDGEIAVNFNANDPAIFIKNSNGDIVRIAGKDNLAFTGYEATIQAAASPPSGLEAGNLYFDTDDNRLYYYYNNGSSTQWVDASTEKFDVTIIPDPTNLSHQSGTLDDRYVNSNGDTMSGNLVLNAGVNINSSDIYLNNGKITFEGASANQHETNLTVIEPTADRTLALPNTTGTLVSTGDTGTVTSAMIVDATIQNTDISNTAAISLSKLATGSLPSGITVASANITDGTIVNADINASAAIALTKLGTGALPSGVTITSSGIAGGVSPTDIASGALPNNVTVSTSNIVNGTIVDADISSSAKIQVSKLADGSSRQLLQVNTAGNNVEWTSNVDIPGTLDVTGNSTFDGNATVAGNFTVNGSTVALNANIVTVKDTNIQLGVVSTPTDTTANGGGITIKGSTDKTFSWLNSSDSWTSSENLDLASGKSYYINGAAVLNQTSLASGVTGSSLTSVGTISNGTWQGTQITDTYLATISTAGKVANTATSATNLNSGNAIVARDGSGDFIARNVTASLIGNASSASKLATARTISLTGDLTGSASFDGTSNIAINTSAVFTGTTNLSYVTGTRTVTSDTGTNAILPLFSNTGAGLTGASGGGTVNYLRADGSWATPTGTATNLGYVAGTSTVTSSTGTGVALPLFSSSNSGLVQGSGGGTTKFLRADGSWIDLGSSSTSIGTSPPASPAPGDSWFDTDEGRTYIYYADTNSSQWVEANPSWNGGIPVGSVIPSYLSTGGPNWDASGNLTAAGSITAASGVITGTLTKGGSNVLTAGDTGTVTTAILANSAVTQAKLDDGSVSASKLAADSVTTTKIVDGAITSAKLATEAVATTNITDVSVTTAKIADSAITSAKIVDGAILNSDINASAAIALTKLANGALPSGITIDSSNLTDLSIVNADVNASAAIAGTKISPNFGSQSITTTGINSTGGIQVTGNVTPTAGSGVELFKASNTSGQIQAFDRSGSAWMDLLIKGKTQNFYTNGSERLRIDSTGKVGIGTSAPSTKLHVVGDVKVVNTGIAYLQPNTVTAFQAYESSGPVKISLNNNGSATFAGNLTSTDGTNYSSIRPGYMVINAPANFGQVIGCYTGSSYSWDITAAGAATFAGNLLCANSKIRAVTSSGHGLLRILNSSSVDTIGLDGTTGAATFAADASINGLTVGHGPGNVSSNTVVGETALVSSSGGYNTAVGHQAMRSNTTGEDNVSVGWLTLYHNTTGQSNTAIGRTAMYTNTTGSSNIAIGRDALRLNTTGSTNVSIGRESSYSNTTGQYNTVCGYQGLYNNTTGYNNSAFGYKALANNSTGTQNTAVGYEAMRYTSTGDNNVAIGLHAMYGNSTGYENVAAGVNALISNSTGAWNTALGYKALQANTTANHNTAVGRNALFSNTGSINTAVGSGAMFGNTVGNYNTAVGYSVLSTSTSGDRNVAMGYQALFSNTSGGYATVMGMYAGYYNTTGMGNDAYGYTALHNNTTGLYNTAIGYQSMYQNTTGHRNTALGLNALYYNTTGTYNVGLGREALNACTTGSANIGIGPTNSAGTFTPVFNVVTESNRLVLGHTSITNAYVKVAWTVTSDERDKMNFAPVPYGLDFVNQLKPTAYQFKVDRDTKTPAGDVRFGFKAQDILALEGDNPVIIDIEDPDHLKYKGEHLVPVLVNAVQELTTMVKELQAEIKTLKG